MRFPHPILPFCLLFVLVACSKSGSSAYNEDEALAAIGFSAPVRVAVNTDFVSDNQSLWQNSNDSLLAALLVKSGKMVVQPNPDAAPWWRLALAEGDTRQTLLFIPVAKRVVTGHSNEQDWTEGPDKFSAVTIGYNIVLDDGIAVDTKTFGPYSMRLVMMFDPAVGKWQVYVGFGRGTYFNPSDAGAMQQDMLVKARPFLPDMGTAVLAAKMKAYDIIQQRLAPDITLSKDGTVLLPKAGLEFARQTFDAASFQQLHETCASLDLGGHKDWRMVTLDDARKIFVYGLAGNSFQNDQPKDTPDRRIWGPTFDFQYKATNSGGQMVMNTRQRQLFLDGFHLPNSQDVRTYSQISAGPPPEWGQQYAWELILEVSDGRASLDNAGNYQPRGGSWEAGAFDTPLIEPDEGRTLCLRNAT